MAWGLEGALNKQACLLFQKKRYTVRIGSLKYGINGLLLSVFSVSDEINVLLSNASKLTFAWLGSHGDLLG